MRQFLLHIAATAVGLVLCAPLLAQPLRTSYFMEGSTIRNSMNPALTPNRGYFNIPVIGSTNFAFTSNALSLDNILYPNPDGSKKLVTFLHGSVDKNTFLSKLKDNNTLDADIGINVLGMGFYAGKAFVTIDFNVKTSMNMGLPKGLFDFAAQSGSGLTGNTYNVDNLMLNMLSYQESAVGYSRPINDRLNIGAKFKFLLGIVDATMKFDRMNIVMNENMWGVDAKGSFKGTGVGLEIPNKVDENGNPTDVLDLDNIKLSSMGPAGMGFGVDLGATYKLLNNLSLSAAVVDLGFINWDAKRSVSATSSANYSFTGGHNPDNGFDGSINDITNFKRDEVASKHKTSLRTTFNIGAEYTILDNLLGFGLLSSTQMRASKTYSELTAMATVRPCSWFSAAASYSMIHSRFQTAGLAINFHPSWINLFIGTDYMIWNVTPQFLPINQKAANVYVGLAIPLGKRPVN